MGRVIQMFITDELTGMRIPNLERNREFIVCSFINGRVQASAIFPTYNQAAAYRAKNNLFWHWIEEI